MYLSSMNENVSRNTPAYVFEIQQVLLREALPVGTENAMLAVADGLTKGTELRTSLGRAVRAIIHRESGRINAMELLSLILTASASPVDSLPSVRMERAMHETLGFILEVRQQRLEDPREVDPGAGMMRGSEMPRTWSEPQIFSGPPEKASLRGRSRVMLVIALCGIFVASLVVGLSRRWQQASENAGAETRALQSSGSGNRPSIVAVVNAERGIEWVPSQNIPFRPKAMVSRSKKSDAQRTPPSHTAPPVAVHISTLPVGKSRINSASASTNLDLSSVSNSITRPREILAGPSTAPRATAGADVSTLVVGPAVSVGGAKPVAPLRRLVQSGSAGIMAANLIWSPTPAYPAAASEAQVEGEVTVNALVGKDGNVLSATVVSGPPLLREAALRAVEKWQYHPYLVSGKPAVIATTAIIDFELAYGPSPQ